MTDDIVTRLRVPLPYNLAGMTTTQLGDERRQAADEIERLQIEISRLMKIICDASPDDDYFLVRQESDAIWEKIHTSNFAKYKHTPIDPVKSKRWKDMGR